MFFFVLFLCIITNFFLTLIFWYAILNFKISWRIRDKIVENENDVISNHSEIILKEE